ncbi:MAG: hypothetical protein WCP62_06715 [Planctomycetota bacterium]
MLSFDLSSKVSTSYATSYAKAVPPVFCDRSVTMCLPVAFLLSQVSSDRTGAAGDLQASGTKIKLTANILAANILAGTEQDPA